MKNFWITAWAALAVTVTSCSNEDDFLTDNPLNGENLVVLSATVGEQQATRSLFDIDEANKTASFLWNTDDAISVFSPANANQEFTLFEGSGTRNGTFATTPPAEVGSLAYYPYHADHTASTFVLPATYGDAGTPYAEDTHAAYRATIENGTAEFRPLVGVLRVVFEEVPAGVDQFVLTAGNKFITGEYDIADGEISTDDAPDNAGKTVTHNFTALDAAKAGMVFYIPLPVGTYSNFRTELKAGGEVVFSKNYTENHEMKLGKLTVIGSLSSPDYTVTTANDGIATYTVYTPVGLQAVNKILTASDVTTEILKSNITLAADIDLTNAPKDATGSNWTAIGTNSKAYTGTFEGNNKTITGVVINTTGANQGLIGYLGNNGMVQNVTLAGCSVTSSNLNVGAFVGYNNTGSKVSNCKLVDGTVSSTYTGADAACIGGIVGVNYATITSCSVSGTVTMAGSDMCVGGITGYNLTGGSISQCSISGDVTVTSSEANVGGITGYNLAGGSISLCSISGDVTVTSGGSNVGGIVGNSKGPVSQCNVNGESGTIKVTSTYSNSNDFVYVGGIVGYSGGAVSQCNVSDNVTVTGSAIAVGGIVGCSISSVSQCNVNSGVTVTSDGQVVGGIVGYNYSATIASCNVNGSVTVTSGGSNVGGIVGYNIGENTTLATVTDCKVINDGSSSLTIHADVWNVGGIAGSNFTGGNLSGCIVKSSTPNGISITTDGNAVGGIVGWNESNVSGCEAINCNVTGLHWVGGIAGANISSGVAAACHAKGMNVSMTLSDGDEDYDSYKNSVGGIAGVNGNTIIGCYAYGTSVTGFVPAAEEKADVVGMNSYTDDSGTSNGIVTQCYYVATGESTLAGYDDACTATEDWATAAAAMNSAISSDEGISAGASPLYTWGGTYDAPTLTNTTSAPAEP